MTTEAERWGNLKWVGGALALSAFAWLALESVKANRELDREAALANPKKRKPKRRRNSELPPMYGPSGGYFTPQGATKYMAKFYKSERAEQTKKDRKKVMKLHHEEGLTLKEAWAEVKRKKNPKRKRRKNR